VQRRALGKTDLTVSELALGTWGLASNAYGPPEDKRLQRIVEKALDKDISVIDMAPVWGSSETVVGKAVGNRRDDVVYATRAGVRFEGDELVTSFEPSALRADLEGSLSRLGTDRVDVWLLHDPPEEELSEEARKSIVELMSALREEQKIRAWGASVTSASQAKLALDAGAEVLSLPYNVLHRSVLDELGDAIAEKGTGVMARSILDYGVLSGRWGESRSFGENDHRRERWSAEGLRTRVRQVNRLRFLVHGEIHSLVCAAMRFVLANERVSTAVLGPRTIGQLEELYGYSKDGAPYLPPEDIARVPEVLKTAAKI
jgi:aryl-alcohol dehydrogenase-like predicted oxidoreductase